MWHVALVVLCVVAAVLVAAVLSAVLGVEQSLKRPASGAAAREGVSTAPRGADHLSAVAVVETSPAAGGEAWRDAPANVPPPKELWVDSEYCWVVVCKNDSFHRHPNIYNVHRIPLGQTDAVEPCPPIKSAFWVQCDECKKKYAYKPSEVLRWEMEAPPSFVPHALFR